MAKSISRYLADATSTTGALDGLLSIAAQTNITSLGTLSSLTVSGSAAMTLTTAAQPNITSVGTLTNLVVDDITINGSTISDGADLTIDVGGDIILDTDGGDIYFHDGGTLFGAVTNSSGFYLISSISDADIFIRGNDGGNFINAVTFDMSDAGAATFNGEVLIPEKLTHAGDTDTHFKFAGANDIRIVAGNVEHAAFDGTIVFNQSGADMDFRVESTSNANMLFVDAGNDRVGIGTNAPTAPLTVLSNSGANAIRMFGRSDNYSELYASSNDGATNYFFIQGHSAQTKLWTLGSTPISLGTNSTERLTVTSGGNVGINETTPTSYYSRTLQINGSGNTAAIKLTNTATGNANNRGHDFSSDSADIRIANREANGHFQVYTTAVTDSPQLAIDASETGAVSMPLQHRMIKSRSSAGNQTIATGTATNVDWHGNESTVGVTYSSGEFTIVDAGVYLINAYARFQTTSTGFNSYLSLHHKPSSGSYSEIAYDYVAGSRGYQQMNINRAKNCAAGDVMRVQIWHNQGGDLPVTGNGSSTAISVIKVA